MAGLDNTAFKASNATPVAYHEHLSMHAYQRNPADGSVQAKSAKIQIGQINSLTEPAGWVSGDRAPRIGLIEYHSRFDPSVQLYTYDRGRRLPPERAQSFADVLYKHGPHTLKATELTSLQENGIVRDKSGSDFTPLIAKTEDLNGRRVLVVEGGFKSTNLHSRTIYIDADVTRDGSVIQELTYEAPEILYHQHLPEARKATQSIIWK